MSFVKKIWKDRISQFPNRRTINDGHTVKRVTVGRDEGVVTEEGTPFDATEMNDLENRIFAAIEQGGGGGGSSGTYDYSELFNKPRVNNVELNGNKTTADLHIDYNDLENKPDIPENATELPISSNDPTDTKSYIDNITDYSTSEKAVGKWIDGSTIYQKTISLGNLPNNTSANTPHGISNLKFVIDFMGFAYITNTVYIPLPYVDLDGIQYGIRLSVDATNVSIKTGSNRSSFYGYVTLRYVKTV